MTKRNTSTVRRALPFVTALAILLFFLFATLAVYQFIFRDRIILGVRVAGQSLSGMTRAEANSFLENKFGKPDAILARVGGERITLRNRDRTWRAWPWEIGLRTDFAPVANTAISLGHRGSIVQIFFEQTQCMWFGCDIGGNAQFDEGIAESYLGWLAAQVDHPARDASVRIEGLRVVTTPSQNGHVLDGSTMLEKLRRHALGKDRGEIELAFRETLPLINDVQHAQVQAETLLAVPALLTFNDRIWAIDQGALASMLSIQPKKDSDGKLRLTASLDHAQLVTYLKTLARDVNQPARDARFHFDDKTLTLSPILSSQNGYALDPEAAAKMIEQQIIASAARVPGLASPLESVNARTMALPVTVTKPTIAVEDTPKFGIKELVSQGISNFRGSIPGRVQNIRTTTAAIDGIVVPPGGIFSFDKYLPEVVEANGYDDAYIIFGDQTVLGPGGGVCQVSTTVFRAAFWGGFPIVERWAHAYRVGFYEPPIGLDATVFAPSVDFKFKNDTDNYLLIQPKIDLRTTTLTFNFYGTKTNRTVEMEDPIKENIIPHGPAIYTEDPTIKKGTTKQVDFEHDGMDVTVYRNIKINGQVVKRDKFFSRYQPWIARYLVGTKVVK